MQMDRLAFLAEPAFVIRRVAGPKEGAQRAVALRLAGLLRPAASMQ